MGRRVADPLVYLARAARQQLVRAETLGKSLDVRLKAKKELAADFIPDEDWRRDFASVTQALKQAGDSLIRALEGNKKDLGGLTEAQLTAQFNAEIVQAAQTLTDEQWAKMCESRAKLAR